MKQRIYRGGSQYHEHDGSYFPSFPGERHAEPKLHDGFWYHYHDDGGMVAVEEEKENERS